MILSLEQRIRETITPALARGTPISIYEVAAQLQTEIPNLSLKELADLVSAVVVAANGNACWDSRDILEKKAVHPCS